MRRHDPVLTYHALDLGQFVRSLAAWLARRP